MRSHLTRPILSALFVVWLFFVLASFFAVQKPFTAANAAAIGRAALDIMVAIWVVLAGLGPGVWLLRRLNAAANLPRLDALVLGAGLGLGLLGLLSLGLGLLGLYRPTVAYGVTLALSLVSAKFLYDCRAQSPLPTAGGRLSAVGGPFPAAYLLLYLVLALLTALLPPTDWDGLFYHLTGPKIYLQAGGIIGGVDLPHLNFPSLMEMLFAWAMLLRGDVAAKLLHLVYGLLLAGLVYGLARRFLGEKAGWRALLVAAGMPMLGTLAGWAYNDLALAFYQLAALYAFIHWTQTGANQRISESASRRISESAIANSSFIPSASLRTSPHPSSLILAGIFAGLAMGLKYTSFVTPLIIIGLILWYSTRTTRFNLQFTIYDLRIALGAVTVFAGVALLVAAPWYLKNWLFTGNPVYPFAFGLFGGQFWDSFRANWYAAAGSGIGFKPATWLALPWLLTLGVRDANYWDGRTGPLLLLFTPLLLVSFTHATRAHRPAALAPLAWFAMAHFAVWAAGVIWSASLWQARLLLPGLAALAPVAGWLWADLPRFDLPRFSLSRFVNLAVGLTLALTLVDAGLLTLKMDPLPYLAGLESRDAFLTRRLGAHYAAMQQINSDLPPTVVVQLLWEPRTYFCARACRPDSILDEFSHLVDRLGAAQAIAQYWRGHGITHVLIHRTGLDFMRRESPQAVNQAVLADLETNWLRPVFDVAGSYQLYKVRTE